MWWFPSTSHYQYCIVSNTDMASTVLASTIPVCCNMISDPDNAIPKVWYQNVLHDTIQCLHINKWYLNISKEHLTLLVQYVSTHFIHYETHFIILVARLHSVSLVMQCQCFAGIIMVPYWWFSHSGIGNRDAGHNEKHFHA